ncbi:MAG: nuclear transport factor 2 family protein [Rhizomicrobium sp.]
MQRSFLSAVCVASLVAWSAAAKAENARGPAADAKQQASQLLRDWVTAENEHDAAALGRILDDQFISTNGAGKPTRKADFIKSLTKGEADPKLSQSLTDETVVVDGDTAILIGTDTFHRTDGAAPDGLALRYTITCVRKRGHWVALAEHIVKMP